MRILITGNMGYVGPVLVKAIKEEWENAKIFGFDTGFFAHCITQDISPEILLERQYFGDMRQFPKNILKNIDAVVHLAAISNDPIGNKFENQTIDINYKSTVDLAKDCIANGIKKFVFASSCSMYGQAEGISRKENDDLNPLTAYAKSKVNSERFLQNFKNDETTITSLRFATACGMSGRLRLDLVLNDFVACAISSKKISVLSDGSPWRPLINIKDMAQAIIWSLKRETSKGGNFLAINAGFNTWNYQIKDLAYKVAEIIGNTEVYINPDAIADKRSYKVDFSLFNSLAPELKPIQKLEETILEIKDGLEKISFSNQNFRESNFMRLKVLQNHIDKNNLDEFLYWKL